jgi:hypothetical protein
MPGSFVNMQSRDEGDPEFVYVDTQAGDIWRRLARRVNIPVTDAPGSRLRGLLVVAWDGTTLKVPASPENTAAFGRPRGGAAVIVGPERDDRRDHQPQDRPAPQVPDGRPDRQRLPVLPAPLAGYPPAGFNFCTRRGGQRLTASRCLCGPGRADRAGGVPRDSHSPARLDTTR